MGKKTKSIKGDKIEKSLTLVEQTLKINEVKPTVHQEKEERPDDQFVGEALQRKITKLSRQQLSEEYQESDSLVKLSNASKTIRKSKKKSNFNRDSDVEEDDLAFVVPDNIDTFLHKFEKQLNISKEDEIALNDFNKRNDCSSVRETLKERVTERFTEIQTQVDGDSVAGEQLSEDLVKIGRKIASLLKTYRSGPLPKQVKNFPFMSNWEQLIFLTQPENWSAAAIYQVTRLFVISQPAYILQRYYTLVVLPRFRDDVSFYRKVNFHIYQTLCKCIYKPAAFHKGILIPLCEDGNCTLREAIILGSVIARKKLPSIHSASAIICLTELDYSGGSSIFLRIYLEKKYQLPHRVIDALIDYYIRYERDQREFPVLWHQSLLSLVQHYKDDITVEQKDDILKLIRTKFHHEISPEIRREIVNSKRSRACPAVVASSSMETD